MKKVENLYKKDTCTGCEACINICPHNVLLPRKDSEGFIIPKISDINLCVDCGLCLNVCQIYQKKKESTILLGYIAQSIYRNQTKLSSSGGAFYTIARCWIEEKKGVVIGASLLDDLSVAHICISSVKDLYKIQGSKYVQSSIGSVYELSRQLLNKGIPVLFSGTPCQIQGLRLYLRKEYDNLLTIDIICHGVTSPQLLKDYVRKVEESEKSSCESIRFRWKNPLFKSGSFFIMMMKMNKGNTIIHSGHDDPYLNVYLRGYAFRESCYNCKYACSSRVGDFTIGDCDSHSYYPSFHPNESNSTILINSAKAESLWTSLFSFFFDSDVLNVDLEVEHNKQLHTPFSRPIERDSIYDVFYRMSYDELMKTYGKPKSKVGRLITIIIMHLPSNLKKLLEKIR